MLYRLERHGIRRPLCRGGQEHRSARLLCEIKRIEHIIGEFVPLCHGLYTKTLLYHPEPRIERVHRMVNEILLGVRTDDKARHANTRPNRPRRRR